MKRMVTLILAVAMMLMGTMVYAEQQQGGFGGGEAHLTEEGKKLLRLYEIYFNKVSEAAEEIFEEVFKGSGMFGIK